MRISDRIEIWLEEQKSKGKTRDEIANTHFAGKGSIAAIRKSGRKDYKLEIYLAPDKAVFFKEDELSVGDVVDRIHNRMEKLELSNSLADKNKLSELAMLVGWIENDEEY